MIINYFLFLLVSNSAEAFNPFDPFGIVDRVKDQISPVHGGNPFGIVDRVRDQFSPVHGGRSGIIFLHGLGPTSAMGPVCSLLSGPALGLSFRRNKISCPNAPPRPTLMLPPTMIPGVAKLTGIRSWFNFWSLPGLSVVLPFASESKNDLKEALRWVEEEIEKMIQEGIPSENIVLTGASQGGALTLYTALHTQYKLGGFIPIVAWVPLLKSEPPASLPTPINKDTPIFHLNGASDPIVPLNAGWASSKAMKQVFTNYQLKNTASTHSTTINPINISKVYCWLKKNVPNMAFSRISPLKTVPCIF